MINIIAPINQLGYGITGLNIVKALYQLTDVSLWPISQPQVTNHEDAEIIKRCMNNSQFTDFDAPCIRIWHQHDMAQFVGRGQKIGFPIFELDKFSDLEKHHLSYLDRIFVCSSWAKSVILDNIDISEDKVNVIPLGVDSTIFKPCEPNNDGPTVFLNCGKWEIRKGHDILVQIFNNAFTESDNVELWMLCDNPFLTQQETETWYKTYYNSKLGSKVKIIPRVQSQEEVYKIMAQCDCGIFPSRAEGWNLDLLEIMSCGKPVITTGYSAHTEFCNTNNSYIVPIKSLEPAYDGKWFFKQGNWANISSHELDLFTEYMKTVHNHKQNKTLLSNIDGIQTAQKFSWQYSAEQVLKYV